MLKILRTTLRQPCGLAKRKMVLRLPQEIPRKCVRRQVHGCRRADVKRALIGECQLTRQELDHFFHFIRILFGNAVANELASVSANDLLVKLLGMKFACDLNMDDMACLRVESFKLLKHLTAGLSLY